MILPGWGTEDTKPLPGAITPPTPKKEDPEIAAEKERLRLAEKKRRGRATILTSGKGVPDEEALLERPGGKNAEVLG